MIVRPRFFTDFFDEQRDLKYSKQITLMVTGTQIAGLGLIAWGVLWLHGLPKLQKTAWYWMLAIGGCSLVAWLLYCWTDVVNDIVDYVDFIEWKIAPLHEAQRKTRVLRGVLLLVMIDTLMLATLIILIGGPGSSPLDPLLPIIPIIAMILQQPKRTVYVALGSGLFVIAVFLIHQAMHEFGIVHPHFGSNWVYDAHSDPFYPMAFGGVAAGAILLSVLEFLISHKMPSLRKGVKEIAEPLLKNNSNAKGIIVSVRQGTKAWLKWLEHRDLPTADLSLVHGEQELIKQAVVLSIPHWIHHSNWGRRRLKRLTRRITFLTLAAHWIDDHFDSLGVYCEDRSLRANILRSSPPQLVKNFYRLTELLKGMERIAHEKHRNQIEKAVVRIIYGGLIQNAESEERLRSLLNEYVGFVSQGLLQELSDFYRSILQSERPVTVWITTKVVMELLDCCSPSFSQKETEFLNLLYGPILYFQDWNDEISKENFGLAFGENPAQIRERLPNCDDLINLLEQCRELVPVVFGGKFPSSRKEQLRVLLSVYGKQLPEQMLACYNKFLTS